MHSGRIMNNAFWCDHCGYCRPFDPDEGLQRAAEMAAEMPNYVEYIETHGRKFRLTTKWYVKEVE